MFCMFILQALRNLKSIVTDAKSSVLCMLYMNTGRHFHQSEGGSCKKYKKFIYISSNKLYWSFFLVLVFFLSFRKYPDINNGHTGRHITDCVKGCLSTEVENLTDLLCPRLLLITRAAPVSSGLPGCQAVKNHQS